MLRGRRRSSLCTERVGHAQKGGQQQVCEGSWHEGDSGETQLRNCAGQTSAGVGYVLATLAAMRSLQEITARGNASVILPISVSPNRTSRMLLPLLTICAALGFTAAAHAQGAMVSGTVHDSVARAPLAGALVQLVADDTRSSFGQSVMSDSVGNFSFRDVPAGRFTLGFHHDKLDSLGLEPMLRTVTVAGQVVVRADLAIPSSARIREALCQAASGRSSAVVMGIVRDASTRAPLSGVTVGADWVELTLGKDGMRRRTVRRTTVTHANGWFAVCDVPQPGSVFLRASRGSDSTDVIEAQVPQDGFLRHELYVGSARIATRGRVVRVTDGRPIVGAQVALENGTPVRTDERGEWVVPAAPAGSRQLEVRAVGFYPLRQSIDVVNGAAPVRLALSTYDDMLDTLKVIANYDRYNRLEEFRARSRSGLGRFITAEDIVRRQPNVTSDLFRNLVPGVYLDSPADTVRMRDPFGERCAPTFYLNGMQLNTLDGMALDAVVTPERIIGIEVYQQSQAPPQFMPALSGCGSILIWTK